MHTALVEVYDPERNQASLDSVYRKYMDYRASKKRIAFRIFTMRKNPHGLCLTKFNLHPSKQKQSIGLLESDEV